jgi:hypothetical protein
VTVPAPDADSRPADPSPYYDRIRARAETARKERESFDPPETVPTEQRAMEYLREGFGPTVWLYVDARTGEWTRLSEREMALLERATNDWLHLYARCFGVDVDPSVTIRTAAELLVETHNVRDTAAVLTHVGREAGGAD